jgi:hypothetical protein
MSWQDACLGLAGLIGSGVAIAHGILLQRIMIRPIAALLVADKGIAAPIRRLVPLLLHFTTVSWFLGGLALIAAFWLESAARLATGLFVGGFYLYGTVIALWSARRPHPAWILMGIAVILIALGLSETGG